MALPTVRMESHAYANLPSPFNLTLATGVVTVTAGRCVVPLLGVKEALQKNFIFSDTNFPWPLPKNAMAPPSPLTQGAYAAKPVAPLTPSGLGPSAYNYPNNTQPMGPSSGWDGMSTAPSGGPDITKFAPAWRPDADLKPYAQVTMGDGYVLQVPNPGLGIVVVPDKYVAYCRDTLSWVLLSDVM
jgi:hypothetical protein